MSVNRRYVIKGIIGSGLVSLSTLSNLPNIETVEDRIRRIFIKCAIIGSSAECPRMSLLIDDQLLTLRQTYSDLIKLSDEAFIKVIEKNIRQDFSESHIVDLAGWQLSRTEIAILRLIS